MNEKMISEISLKNLEKVSGGASKSNKVNLLDIKTLETMRVLYNENEPWNIITITVGTTGKSKTFKECTRCNKLFHLEWNQRCTKCEPGNGESIGLKVYKIINK